MEANSVLESMGLLSHAKALFKGVFQQNRPIAVFRLVDFQIKLTTALCLTAAIKWALISALLRAATGQWRNM
jgi:hypothetical protein